MPAVSPAWKPVYAASGGSPEWVDWFTNSLIHQPCLAFGYAQVGQENSFGWPSIKKGLTMQMNKLDVQSKAGEIQIETLASIRRMVSISFRGDTGYGGSCAG